MEMLGTRLDLYSYAADGVSTSRHFSTAQGFNSIYLPESVIPLMNAESEGKREFVEDDNRGAISPEPVATIDGTEFHLSVKGIGSTTDPFSMQLLNGEYVSSLVRDMSLREKILKGSTSGPARFITGELWLTGSPYGGQGLEHAATAMRVSEMANITSINGFRIAPVVSIAFLPEELEKQLKKIYRERCTCSSILSSTLPLSKILSSIPSRSTK